MFLWIYLRPGGAADKRRFAVRMLNRRISGGLFLHDGQRALRG